MTDLPPIVGSSVDISKANFENRIASRNVRALMPVLPICEEDGRIGPAAPIIVFRSMLFPDQPERRRELLDGAVADLCIRHNMPTDPVLAGRLREMPSRQYLKKQADERFETGGYVGLVFCTVLSLARFSEVAPRASVNTVVSVMDRRWKNLRIASKRTLLDWWGIMAPVRHLWAAWIARGAVFNHLEYLETDAGPVSYTVQDDLAQFLLEALAALDAGAAYRSSAANRKAAPLVDPAVSLIPPPEWRRPDPVGPFGRFRLRQPAPELLNDIARMVRGRSTAYYKRRGNEK